MLSFDRLVVGPAIAAFGEKAQGYDLPLYAPATGGTPFSVDGVFDDAYREIDKVTELPVSSAAPMLGVRLADFPIGSEPQQGDLLTIRGAGYLVREVRPDSHGWARLLLNAVDRTVTNLPVPQAGVTVGGYSFVEDADGNLQIRTPDGSLVPLVTK